MGRHGDVDGAIEVIRSVVDTDLRSGSVIWLGVVTAVFVESLLQRGSEADLRKAKPAIAKLAAVPVEPGVVIFEV